MPETIRPTKKQRELLTYIEGFIKEHGYSPSYREIMQALNYNSVATVALHINNLIKRGHLQKRDHSARSLEVTQDQLDTKLSTNEIKPGEEKWFIDKINHFFNSAEQSGQPSPGEIAGLEILLNALKVLGLEGAAQSFVPRLAKLKGIKK